MQGAESWTQRSLAGPFQLDIFLLKTSVLICSIIYQLCSNEGIAYCPLLFQWVKLRMEKNKDLSELCQVPTNFIKMQAFPKRQKEEFTSRKNKAFRIQPRHLSSKALSKPNSGAGFCFCSLLLLELWSKVHVPDWFLKAINEKWHFKIIVARSCSSELSYCMFKAHSFPKVRYKKV